MIAESNLEALSKLYDKHAPVMFNTICNLTKVTTIAVEILKESFSQSKDKQILSKASYPLFLSLPRYTYARMLQQLKEREISSFKNPIHENSLINIFFGTHQYKRNSI